MLAPSPVAENKYHMALDAAIATAAWPHRTARHRFGSLVAEHPAPRVGLAPELCDKCLPFFGSVASFHAAASGTAMQGKSAETGGTFGYVDLEKYHGADATTSEPGLAMRSRGDRGRMVSERDYSRHYSERDCH
jgi:hypothetical protein